MPSWPCCALTNHRPPKSIQPPTIRCFPTISTVRYPKLSPTITFWNWQSPWHPSSGWPSSSCSWSSSASPHCSFFRYRASFVASSPRRSSPTIWVIACDTFQISSCLASSLPSEKPWTRSEICRLGKVPRRPIPMTPALDTLAPVLINSASLERREMYVDRSRLFPQLSQLATDILLSEYGIWNCDRIISMATAYVSIFHGFLRRNKVSTNANLSMQYNLSCNTKCIFPVLLSRSSSSLRASWNWCKKRSIRMRKKIY